MLRDMSIRITVVISKFSEECGGSEKTSRVRSGLRRGLWGCGMRVLVGAYTYSTSTISERL
jgi:hypothetical protein